MSAVKVDSRPPEAARKDLPALVERPEIVVESMENTFGVVQKKLTAWERVYGNNVVRKLFILVVLAAFWEMYASNLNNDLLFPTFSATASALAKSLISGGLTGKIFLSIQTLLIGYLAGLTLAALLTVLAITTRLGRDFLETLTAMFNPLPAIALLPLAFLWFGVGNGSIVFVLVHSVLWAVALNSYSGFMSVSNTLRMVGQNYGLKGFSYVCKILIPAGFPSILTGLKIGWAFAWRTLIAAELVFGVSSGNGGLGWFIYENKNALEIANVFAGLLMVILIGLLVENLIFKTVERRTIHRWGLHA